jgi:hypothetical protein
MNPVKSEDRALLTLYKTIKLGWSPLVATVSHSKPAINMSGADTTNAPTLLVANLVVDPPSLLVEL